MEPRMLLLSMVLEQIETDYSADLSGDGVVNIIDAVQLVNIILSD